MNNKFRDVMVTQDVIIGKSERVVYGNGAPAGELFLHDGYNSKGRRILKPIAHNLVVVGGAITALENLTGVIADWKPRTLNEIYGIPATVSGRPTLCLYGAGTGGANLQFGSVIAPDIKQENVLEPIPIRYTSVLTGDDANSYFLKKANSDGSTFSYYVKEFATQPIIKSCWKNSADPDVDGTEITTDIYNSENTEGIETFTEFTISLNTKDFREYFDAQGNLPNARYNTFGFYTATPTADGSEYGDVRLYSAITFNNRDLSVPSSATFVYRVYSLI